MRIRRKIPLFRSYICRGMITRSNGEPITYETIVKAYDARDAISIAEVRFIQYAKRTLPPSQYIGYDLAKIISISTRETNVLEKSITEFSIQPGEEISQYLFAMRHSRDEV